MTPGTLATPPGIVGGRGGAIAPATSHLKNLIEQSATEALPCREKPSKPSRIVSLLALSELLEGFASRGTLAKWAQEGTIPCVSRPDESGAGEWEFCIPDVMKALIAEKARQAIDEMVPAGSDPDLDEELNPVNVDEKTAKRRRAVWDAHKAKADALLKILELKRQMAEVIEIDKICAVIAPQTRAVREGVLDIAPRVASKVPDPELRVQVQNWIYDEANEVLAVLTADREFDGGDGAGA